MSSAFQIAMQDMGKLIEQANLGQVAFDKAIEPIAEQLSDIALKLRGSVNIYEFEHLKIGTDWTNAITAALAKVKVGGELIFAEGIYEHYGIVVTKTVNIRGCGKYATRLKNLSLVAPAVTILSNVEKGTFKDISCWGNGTSNFGVDATSGKGFQFNNNSVCWNFDNIWMRGHGDWFFYAEGNGHVNNINITNSELEWGKKGAIHLIQSNTANQINAVNIINCNISGFGGNGIEVWGQSISIQGCAIQACKNRGIVVDGSISPIGQSSSYSIRIDNNYFELCNNGFIFAKAIVSPYPRYLYNLSVSNNYGVYDVIPGDVVNTSLVSLVEIQAPGWYDYDNFQVSGLNYQSNSFLRGFSAPAGNIFNGNDVLAPNCVIQRTAISSTETQYYIGLGRAKIIDNYGDMVVIKGITHCVNNAYTIDKSANVTVNTDLIFDLRNYSKGNFTGMDVPVVSDATNYTVSIVKKYRPAGSTAAYSDQVLHNWTNQAGSQLLKKNFTNNGKSNQYEDFYIVIRVVFNAGNTMTNFAVGNPVIYLNN